MDKDPDICPLLVSILGLCPLFLCEAQFAKVTDAVLNSRVFFSQGAVKASWKKRTFVFMNEADNFEIRCMCLVLIRAIWP